METNQEWKSPYALSKGYPFSGCKSQETFKNRPGFTLDGDGAVQIIIDKDIYPDCPPLLNTDNDGLAFTGIKDLKKDFEANKAFLLNRLYDYDMALTIAEQQIIDMMHDSPFIPESFGFEVLAKPSDIHDAPVTIYGSKFRPDISLYQDAESINDWVLLRKDEVGFTKIPVKLSSQRCAVQLFFALGIKVQEEKVVEALSLKQKVLQAIDEENAGIETSYAENMLFAINEVEKGNPEYTITENSVIRISPSVINERLEWSMNDLLLDFNLPF